MIVSSKRLQEDSNMLISQWLSGLLQLGCNSSTQPFNSTLT